MENQTKDEFDPGKVDLPGDAAPAVQRTKQPKVKVALVVLAIAGLGALGYGAYVWIAQTDEPVSSTKQSTSSPESQGQSGPEAQELTETFTSTNLRLELKHPNDWQVEEANRGVRIDSPAFIYTTAGGVEVEGNFKVYIRKGARTLDGKYLGQGFAIKPSEKINYSEPATDQREDTFLTAFGLDAPDNFAYFIVQGNFDLKKGQTLGPTFAKEIEAYLIFGGYGSKDLEDDLGTNSLPTADYDKTSQYKTAVEIVKSLKLN